jgi:hypothetical protein
MRPPLIFLILTLSFSLHGQDYKGYLKEKANQDYHKFRQHLSYPPYGLDKVNTLIRKQVIQDSEDNLVLKEKTYSSLSFREKFTYNMLNAESYSQNCDAMPPIQDEQKKIFGYLPDAFDEYSWSDRQLDYFKNNHDSVVALMKQCIIKNNRVGVNFKHIISEINAKELIPLLVKTYSSSKKDNDILTLLMMLMNDNKYDPFLKSTACKKLYGDQSNYEGFLVLNKANADLIIKRATDFYDGSKK